MVLSGYICALHTNEGMADQPVKKKLRIDAPDIDDGSDKSTEDVLTDIFDSETAAETSEEFPSRNGESPDSGTVSEDAVDCSAILRFPNDSAVEIIPSCSFTTPHWNTEDDKLLAELRILQQTLVDQCLCTLNENVISQLFDRRLKFVNWSVTCSLTYLSTMQLMFDIYLKQNNTGTICSRLMHACDIFVRNQHDWITYVIELADHKSKYITFVASRVLASFLIVAKDTINENWLKQIAENIYIFERINRITIQKINFSLDVIKRIVEWKDVEQHPLEDSNYIKTSVNIHVQEDNPFRSNVGYGASSSNCQPSSSHSDNLHSAFSNLQTHSVASTSSGEKSTETRPVMFRLQEPVLKFPNLNQQTSEGEQSNPVSPEPPPSRIERLNESGCVTVILTDSESFDTSHIKCLTIKTLERHWPILVNNMKLLLLRYLNLANAENCILTFFSLWENIISVKANLSVIDTKRFYADLQSFVDLLRDTNIPSLIYTHMLSLFNEVLCYGSTLALQDILPEEICNLAHSIVRFVKDFRLLNDVRIQNSRNGFGFLGHECVIIRNYSLGPEVAPLSSSIQLVDQSYGEDDNEDDPSHARGEVDKTMLQRMSLLVLKSVAVTVKEMRCDSSDSSIDSSDYNAIQDMQIVERSIRDVLKKLDLFIRNTLEFHPETPFTKMLVHLFSEQDDYLIESMVCTLDITVGIVYRNSMYPDLIIMLNPIASFIEFLTIVSNDSDVLLDYLVSNETCFLLYLLRFLKYVRRNWPKFIETCQQSDSGTRGLDNTMRVIIRLRLQISRLVSKSLFPYNIGPVLRLLELCESLYEGNELS